MNVVGNQPFPFPTAKTDAEFSQPAVGETVNVLLDDASEMLVEDVLHIWGAGHYRITAIPGANIITLENLGWPDSLGESMAVAAGTLVRMPCTLQFELRNPDGKNCIICGSPSRLYRFFALETSEYFTSFGSNTPYIEETGPNTPYLVDQSGEWRLIGSGFSGYGHRWEAVAVNGYAVFNNGFDLPVLYRMSYWEVEPLYELREAGVAAVETIAQSSGVLLCTDITEIQDDHLADVMGGSDPYGPVTSDEYLNRVQYRIIWPGVGEPGRWGANVLGSISAGSDFLTLQYAVESIKPGDEIIIAGAGVNGGNHQTTVQFVSGTTINLVDQAITTVANVVVQKSDAQGLIAGSQLLQGDGSAILRILETKEAFVVLKATGNYVGNYTGDFDAPFEFSNEYPTPFPLYWRWSAISVNGDAVLYAARDDFYIFDVISRVPVLAAKLALCSDVFFDYVDEEQMEFLWMARNELTNEIWIKLGPDTPDDTFLCYDYLNDECSTVDRQDITAAATVDKPVTGALVGTPQRWFIMGTTLGEVLQYGLIRSASIYTRNARQLDNTRPTGQQDSPDYYTSRLNGGLAAFGKFLDEVHVGGFMVLVSSKTPTPPPAVAVEVEKYANTASSPVSVGSKIFGDIHNAPVLATHVKAAFVRELLSWSGEFRLTGRAWLWRPISSAGATRTTTGTGSPIQS